MEKMKYKGAQEKELTKSDASSPLSDFKGIIHTEIGKAGKRMGFDHSPPSSIRNMWTTPKKNMHMSYC